MIPIFLYLGKLKKHEDYSITRLAKRGYEHVLCHGGHHLNRKGKGILCYTKDTSDDKDKMYIYYQISKDLYTYIGEDIQRYDAKLMILLRNI